jgi:hypothetical protein
MILDVGTGERAAFEAPFDVCVVGAGPAGITLARRLAGQGARVALMEGGGLEISAESQALYEGDIVGEEYFPLDITRLRYFGGTSNHWTGYCREFLPEDFLPRAGDPWSGWPITKADLDPYQAETDAILDLPPASDFPLYDVPGDDFRGFEMRHSPPTRFAEKYHDEIAASDLISLGLNANLVDLRLDDAGEAAIFRTYHPGSPDLEIRASVYVLCLGGLVNPRALLNANRQRPAGLGNEHDLVGRFFCEHLHYVIGEVLLEEPLAAKIKLTPTPAFRERDEVTNFVLLAQTFDFGPPLVLYKEVIRSIPCASDFTERLAREVLGRSLNCRGRGVGGWLEQREERAAVLADPRTDLLVRSEQAMNPDSRVSLSDAVDSFGLRRIVLDWRISEADYHTMRVAAIDCSAA